MHAICRPNSDIKHVHAKFMHTAGQMQALIQDIFFWINQEHKPLIRSLIKSNYNILDIFLQNKPNPSKTISIHHKQTSNQLTTYLISVEEINENNKMRVTIHLNLNSVFNNFNFIFNFDIFNLL